MVNDGQSQVESNKWYVVTSRHSKCLKRHNQRLCNFFFDLRKFGAFNIQCFVINLLVSFLHTFCVKIQANEGKK